MYYIVDKYNTNISLDKYNDLIEKLMKIMFWFIVSYFVIVFIPQLLAKLL